MRLPALAEPASHREPDQPPDDDENDDQDEDGLPDTREETPGLELGGEEASLNHKEVHSVRS